MASWAAVVTYVTVVPPHENKPRNKSKYCDNKKLIKNNKKRQHKEEKIHKQSKQEEIYEFDQPVSHRFNSDNKPPEGPG